MSFSVGCILGTMSSTTSISFSIFSGSMSSSSFFSFMSIFSIFISSTKCSLLSSVLSLLSKKSPSSLRVATSTSSGFLGASLILAAVLTMLVRTLLFTVIMLSGVCRFLLCLSMFLTAFLVS